MASQNDIGSKSQRIGNPLRMLGLIQTAAGLFTLYIGIQLLLQVSGLVVQFASSVSKGSEPAGPAGSALGMNPAAWLALIFGLIIVVKGGMHTFAGLFKCLSIVVGRNDPKSLAHNLANPSESQMNICYSSAELGDMLNARQNKTFVEPRCWVESLYYTVFRRMFFLPPPYRNIIQGCLAAIINTSVVLICYGVVAFMVSSGLVRGDNAALVVNLCLIAFTVKLLFIWRNAFIVERNKISAPDSISFKSLILNIAFSVLVPAFLVAVFEFVTVPAQGIFRETVDSFNQFPWKTWFWYFSLIPLALTLPIFFMCWCKTNEYNLKTEVSERIVDWQESIHPKDLFIAIDNNVMAKRRYMEVPNRIYSEFQPALQSNSSQSKGEYSGYTIQETQPVYTKPEQSVFFVAVKYLTAIAAGALTAYTYNFLGGIVGEFSRNWGGNFQIGIGYVILGYALNLMILFVICRLLWGVANLFFSELKFTSLMIYYKNSGTYTTSKVSVGASIYDSNRSENTVVRSSFHQWIIVSKIVSATFLARGFSKFESARYIMEMHEAAATVDAMLDDLRRYLDSFSIVAPVAGSSVNAQTADQIMQMNARSQAVTKVALENAEQLVNEKPASLNSDFQVNQELSNRQADAGDDMIVGNYETEPELAHVEGNHQN
ncbi:MAG: hypothetical protein IJ523_01655 [Succinivibrionaceae bacterium]|nr:hypothetical protein [Succinivibrionaceae bacterium]